MYQVLGLEKMSSCCLMLALTGTSRSQMKARIAATMHHGMKKAAAL